MWVIKYHPLVILKNVPQNVFPYNENFLKEWDLGTAMNKENITILWDVEALWLYLSVPWKSCTAQTGIFRAGHLETHLRLFSRSLFSPLRVSFNFFFRGTDLLPLFFSHAWIVLYSSSGQRQVKLVPHPIFTCDIIEV